MSRSRLAKLDAKMDRLLVPFFKGLPYIAFIAIAIEFSLQPLLHGALSDPDDYLYLTQAMDWLHGQGWFDLIQHRMNPPTGTYIHFSHILSGFYGCLIFPLRFFLGTTKAAMTVAIIIPIIYLLFFIFAIHDLAGNFIEKKGIFLVDFISLFSTAILFEFKPGHLDHHGLEILLAVAAAGFLARMTLQPARQIWAILAALTLAFALAIGLEILPFYLVCATWVGLQSIFRGKAAVKNAYAFGVVLFAVSLFLLTVTRPVGMLFQVDVQVYSITYALLAGSIGLCFTGIALADRLSYRYARHAAGFLLALLTGAVFICVFPEMSAGPYGGTNPALLHLIVDNESESWPLAKLKGIGVMMSLWPLIALAASCVFITKEKKIAHRWLWGLFALVLGVCIPLSFFYECRFQNYVETFAVIPLAYAIWNDWNKLSVLRSPKQSLRLVRLVILLVIGPAALLTFASTRDHEKSEASTDASNCNLHDVADLLNNPKHYGDHSRIIINSMDQGAGLLFLTPHAVLASPFHMDKSGNLDTLAFFTTHDPDEAHAIAKRRGAELVLFCNLPSQMIPYTPDGNADDPYFIQQLSMGRIPNWLKPIKSPSAHKLMLFEVRS